MPGRDADPILNQVLDYVEGRVPWPAATVALNPPITSNDNSNTAYGNNLRAAVYGAKGDGVTDDTAAIAAWFAGGNRHLTASIGAYVTTGFTPPTTDYLWIDGAGMGNTIFKASGAVNVITMPIALEVKLSNLTVDGANTATRGVYAPAGAGIRSRYHDVEIINCKGSPGTGFEAVNNTYSMDWRRCKINNNNFGMRLTKSVQNSHFYSCGVWGNQTAAVIIGDGATIVVGPIGFNGCDIEHTASQSAQDCIQASGVQPLVITDCYFEAVLAGSTMVRLSSALPTQLVINGVYAAGASLCPNPIVIDAAAGGSTVSLDGFQFNGFTGNPVLDNSTGSSVTQFPGRNSGGMTDMQFGERVLIAPTAGTAAPLLKVTAASAFTGKAFDLVIAGSVAEMFWTAELGLLTVIPPANAGGITQSNGNGSGIAYWRNVQAQGHNFEQGSSGSSTTLWRLDQYGHWHAPFAGTPASSALGANVTSVTATGNDVGGSLAIVMAGALAANTKIATVTFANTMGASVPRVILLVNQTSGAGLANVQFYYTPTTGVSFDLFCNQPLAAGTYAVAYLAIGQRAS